jgi:hypothetical protein
MKRGKLVTGSCERIRGHRCAGVEVQHPARRARSVPEFFHAFLSRFCGPVVLAAVILPAGSMLEVRLTSRVASNASKPQDPVQAVLISPALADGAIAIPAGAALRGVVKQAVPIKTPADRALLELDFRSLTLPSGTTLPIESRVTQVDNARESVKDGCITGILASESLAARIQSGIDKVSQKHSRLGGFLDTINSAVLSEPEPEIVYEPGVEMTIELLKPLTVDSSPPAEISAVTPEPEIFRLVNAQPFRTATEDQGVPSDLTNLMFLGSQEQIEAAFTAAGWSSAARLTQLTGLEVFRAVAEMRGYKEAPMSVLLLGGRKPDLVFEKQNNTFAMRHHLRIWRRPDQFQGRAVWVCAATHDTGIEFSPEKRNFIHTVDSQIDRERAKVVADLAFAGHVKALSLVARAPVPRNSQNATGDRLETDGRMAVLLLE